VSQQIQWAKRALKTVARLDRPTRDRITAGINTLADLKEGDVRRLRGAPDETYRLRVGTWRVLFTYLNDSIILVLEVGPRGDVYKK
jgi:mRNA interferase RelE/StbE